MYQWKEHESRETRKKLGGGTETVTTYEYKKEWASGRIDSSSFKKTDGHESPVLGIALLVVAAAGIFGLIKVGGGRKAARAAAAKPVPAR